MTRHLCMVTGTRAEWGILHALARELLSRPEFQFSLLVTGAHLSPEFGMTVAEIEQDRIPVAARVEMLVSSDSRLGVCKSMGLGLIGLAEKISDLRPDILIVYGDRYETFCAATVGLILGIPVAHISGGECTEGAFDEALRHAITKLSHFHFCATMAFRSRVIQMGEAPERVFGVGELGLSDLGTLPYLAPEALQRRFGIPFDRDTYLITFHPETHRLEGSFQGLQNLLHVLLEMPGKRFVFTMGNADPDGNRFNQLLADVLPPFAQRAVLVESMGRLAYLSALRCVGGVVGNSSSGIIEAPFFKVGTINLGDRQKGRPRARSVIDAGFRPDEIRQAFATLESAEFQAGLAGVTNPFFMGNAAKAIAELLSNLEVPASLRKPFFSAFPD